ncbi:phospholipase, partial [Stenotrophomonas maltophilia]|nr:phospholipase [Stenotrophomonas maltophilia]
SMDLGNGLQVITRKFARDLRMKLWRKFLGEEIAVNDGKERGYAESNATSPYYPPFQKRPRSAFVELPVASSTWREIGKIADLNLATYHRVFSNIPGDSMARYDSVFQCFPAAGFNEKGHQLRMLHAQPPDLQPEFMIEPSQLADGATVSVGRHDVAKAMSFMKDQKNLHGFWVSMPLLWGHGMDDPAAAMPNQIIAAAPALGSSEVLLALNDKKSSSVSGAHS